MPSVPLGGVGPSLGSALGKGIAQPFEEGLNLLAQKKLMQIQQQQQQQAAQTERKRYAQGLAPLLGQETAQFLSSLGPEERKAALQNIGSLMQLGGMGGQPMQQQQGPLQESMQQLQQLQNPMNVANFMGLQGQQSNQAMLPEQQMMPQEQQNGMQGPLQPGMQNKSKLIEDIFTSPHEKREQRKIEIQEKKLALQEQQYAMKETKAYADTVLKDQKAQKMNDLRLNRMNKLIDDNKLPNAALWKFLSDIEDSGISNVGGGGLAGAALGSAFPGIGTVIGGIAGSVVGALASPLAGAAKSIIRKDNPDIDEFEKLSGDFVKNAKDIFGSRITDADLKAYMKTIPTLMQTDAGKKAVIANLKAVNEMGKVEAETMRQIIKENGGKRPIDLEQQVYDRMGDQLDELAQLFIIR